MCLDCTCAIAGYLQWKALLVLFLGCERGPLETHVQLFEQFLAVLRAQLRIGLDGMASTRKSALDAQEDFQSPVTFDVSMLEELLVDSFLHHSLRDFFEVLEDESGAQHCMSPTLKAEVMSWVGEIDQG